MSGLYRCRWRLCRPALRKGFAFPGRCPPFILLRPCWKAQPSSMGGEGYLGCPSVGKAEPFRTASGGAAHQSPSAAAQFGKACAMTCPYGEILRAFLLLDSSQFEDIRLGQGQGGFRNRGNLDPQLPAFLPPFERRAPAQQLDRGGCRRSRRAEHEF